MLISWKMLFYFSFVITEKNLISKILQLNPYLICYMTFLRYFQRYLPCSSEYTVLDIHFQSLKCTAETRIRKNFDGLFTAIQVLQKIIKSS